MCSLNFMRYIKTFKFSGSKQQLVSQFVASTRIISKYNAQIALQMQNWDLDKAIHWFHEHKNDDEYKNGAETEFDSNEKEQGKVFVLPSLKSSNQKIVSIDIFMNFQTNECYFQMSYV